MGREWVMISLEMKGREERRAEEERDTFSSNSIHRASVPKKEVEPPNQEVSAFFLYLG